MAMASLGNQQTWVPYENTDDCSKGFCSQHCPQWCYIIFPPPPPWGFAFPAQDSGPNLSPGVIAVIGILASAFLIASYCTLVSKYCGNTDWQPEEGFNGSRDGGSPWRQEPLQQAAGGSIGLDEAFINSITVCKYKRGDGLIEGTDCSVCLCEFREGENLRLLPKCSHAFHLPCIDMWLKSHSNCPLCRAAIATISAPAATSPLPPVADERTPHNYRPSLESPNPYESHTVLTVGNSEASEDDDEQSSVMSPKSSRATNTDGGRGSFEERDVVVPIRDGEMLRPNGASFSMNAYQHRISIAQVLMMSTEEDRPMNNAGTGRFASEFCSSKSAAGDHHKHDMVNRSMSRALNCVMSPAAMKRPTSSGRFMLTMQGRGRT